MKNQLIDFEAAVRALGINKIKDSSAQLKKQKMIVAVATGASLGIAPLLMRKPKLKWMAALTVVGAALGFGYVKYIESQEVDHISLKEDKDTLKEQAEETLKVVTQSADNLFSAFVDDFIPEHDLYNAYFDAGTSEESLKSLRESIAIADEAAEIFRREALEIEALATEMDKSVLSAKNLLDSALEESKSGGLPVPPSIRNKYEELQAGALETRKRAGDAARSSMEQTQLSSQLYLQVLEAQKMLDMSMSTINRTASTLPNVILNRASKSVYHGVYIKPLESIVVGIDRLPCLPPDVETLFDAMAVDIEMSRYKAILSMIKEDFDSLAATYEKMSQEHMDRAARSYSGEPDLTYAAAPFYKLFDIRPSSSLASKEAVKAYMEEIKAGAMDDIQNKREKGTWLLCQNFRSEWLFSLGDFSDAEAEELSELMKGILTTPVSRSMSEKEINTAYKEFARRYHSDMNNEADCETFQRGAHLVKKLRDYLKSQALWKERAYGTASERTHQPEGAEPAGDTERQV